MPYSSVNKIEYALKKIDYGSRHILEFEVIPGQYQDKLNWDYLSKFTDFRTAFPDEYYEGDHETVTSLYDCLELYR